MKYIAFNSHFVDLTINTQHNSYISILIVCALYTHGYNFNLSLNVGDDLHNIKIS